MTWREQIAVKILLLVARIFTDDPAIRDEIKNIATTISLYNTKETS